MPHPPPHSDAPWRILWLFCLLPGCVQAHDVLNATATSPPQRDATATPNDQGLRDLATNDQALPADQGQVDLASSAGPRGTTVSCGQYFTCAIRPQGGLYCWGRNTSGQLGTGDLLERATPARVSEDAQDPWVAVSAGRETACALRQGGSVWCWGQNEGGQVIPEGQSAVPLPTEIPLPSKATHISTGSLHACALLDTGRLWCWGDREEGKLGPNVMPSSGAGRPVLIEDTPGWRQIASGSGHSCGLRQGKIWCWGRNTTAQLGTGSTQPQGTNQLQQVVGGTGVWEQVQVGQQHTCGLDSEGQLWCWGSNAARQIAFDQATDLLPAPQPLGGPWDSLVLSPFHTCALSDTTGKLVCRGRNAEGQLGLDPPPPNASDADPRPATELPGRWGEAAMGWFHLCGWDLQGQMRCLGRNLEGQLGADPRNYINVEPVTVVF